MQEKNHFVEVLLIVAVSFIIFCVIMIVQLPRIALIGGEGFTTPGNWFFMDHGSSKATMTKLPMYDGKQNVLYFDNLESHEHWVEQIRTVEEVEKGQKRVVSFAVKGAVAGPIYYEVDDGTKIHWFPVQVTTEWKSYSFPYTVENLTGFAKMSMQLGEYVGDLWISNLQDTAN